MWALPVLHHFEVRVLQHQPLRTLAREVDLDTRVRALALDVEHHALAELAMPHAGSQTHAPADALDQHRTREFARPHRLTRGAAHDADARANLFEQLGWNLLQEAGGRLVAVDAVQPALLGIGEVERAHRARHADIAQPAP